MKPSLLEDARFRRDRCCWLLQENPSKETQMYGSKSQCLGFFRDVRDYARQAEETADIPWTTLHGSTGIIDSDWPAMPGSNVPQVAAESLGSRHS